ncbi:MAG: DEAD/DEAH box helicase [Sphingomonadaceae bacterium]|nr:DEAD/DEAH box helicase [Sphingomonadaceae bacterium]
MTDFNSFGLAEPLTQALSALKFHTPTPIQAQAIPVGLTGRDLLGIAQTGTGKTAAFALPILDRLSRNPAAPPRHSTRVLVLAPTRELASQIADSFRDLGRNLKLRVSVVVGGVPIGRQMKACAAGLDVLVATPGRLLDLIDERALVLSNVEVLVLDEADQMLDLGFIHSLKRIVGLLPRRRQTMLFSATMPDSIADLAQRYLTDPQRVAVTPVASTAERVAQRMTHVNQAEKQALLTVHLRSAEVERALVFTRTKHGADRVVRKLAGAGIAAAAIHGNKSQPQREKALAAFRDGSMRVLVATDIAARGIDVPGVSHVFNFEIPNVPEQYVHRIGRTARAGREGLAWSYVAPDEKPYIRDIERLTRQPIAPAPLPPNFMAEVAAVKSIPDVNPERDERDERLGGRGRGAAGARGQDGRGRQGPRSGAPGGQRSGGGRHADGRAVARGPVGNPLRGGFDPVPRADRADVPAEPAGRPMRQAQRALGGTAGEASRHNAGRPGEPNRQRPPQRPGDGQRVGRPLQPSRPAQGGDRGPRGRARG